MAFAFSPDSGAAEERRLTYIPLHDRTVVDVDAWAEQWFGRLSQLDSNGRQYHDAERFIAAQFGLHPGMRKIDAGDLRLIMESLSMIGVDNPHDPNSNLESERYEYKCWEMCRNLGVMVGRQFVRSTLDEADHYAAFRVEQDRAGRDYLTGTANRRGLVRRLREEYGITDEPSRRNEQGEALRPVRLSHIYCDANMFKWINDTLGHHIGDATIIEMAREIQEMFRLPDTVLVYRYGGDEFGVIMEGVPDGELDQISKRIINEQISKVQVNLTRAEAAIKERMRQVRQSGERVRIEAAPALVPSESVQEEGVERSLLYINGAAVCELRDIVTISLGAKSGLVSSLDDVDSLRRASEDAMIGAKQVFHTILARVLKGDPRQSLHEQ